MSLPITQCNQCQTIYNKVDDCPYCVGINSECRCKQPIFLDTNNCLNCGKLLRASYRGAKNPEVIVADKMTKASEGYKIAEQQTQNNMYAKRIWNEAIEAAALIADEADEIAATDIRKLKQ